MVSQKSMMDSGDEDTDVLNLQVKYLSLTRVKTANRLFRLFSADPVVPTHNKKFVVDHSPAGTGYRRPPRYRSLAENGGTVARFDEAKRRSRCW